MSETITAPVAHQPSAELRKLDVMVGTWRVSSGAEGTIRFEWLPGGFFLLQHVDLVQDGRRVRGIEVIGHERPFDAGPSEEIKSGSTTPTATPPTTCTRSARMAVRSPSGAARRDRRRSARPR